MVRLLASFAAVVLGVGLFAAAPAAAAGEHCATGAYCLFSGTNYTGTKAVVPSGLGCHTVASLGFPAARSAARGFGDSYALQLYADTACTSSLGNVNTDVPSTNAKGYRLVPIPAGIGKTPGKTHCAAAGFCLFSFTDYQGVAKAVNTAPGCHSIVPLGIPWAHSAARGTPSAGDLVLFADSTCHSVFDKLTTADLPDTYALSYEVVPVSS